MALPEKSFFTLEEVARRWDCDVLAILSYGMTPRAADAAARKSREYNDAPLLRLHALVPAGSCQRETLEELGKRGPGVPKEYAPTLEYWLPEIPAIFVCNLIAKGSVQLRYGYFRDQHDVVHRGELVEAGSFSDPIRIEVKDVVITRRDRDALERACGIGIVEGEAQERDVHPRTRNT